MIVVDSSVWIDHFRGNPTPRRAVLADLLSSGAKVAITDVIYMELLRGVAREKDVGPLRALLRHTEILSTRSLTDYEVAADLFRRVRRSGRTIRQSTDCLIAAVAIRESTPLLHDDRDFDVLAEISDLQVVG